MLVFLHDELHAGLPVAPPPRGGGGGGGDDERPRKCILVAEVLYERFAPPADGEC